MIKSLTHADWKKKEAQRTFMARTASIYRHQLERAKEKGAVYDAPSMTTTYPDLPYSLDELRTLVAARIDKFCPHCGKTITVKNFSLDHDTPVERAVTLPNRGFVLSNLTVMDRGCNNEKGIMTLPEYATFLDMVRKNLPPLAVADIRRRLRIGGTWGHKTQPPPPRNQ